MISAADSTRILEALNSSQLTGRALRRLAMEQLDTLDTYNWSGIYRLEGDTLILDEYVGAATDHTHIPVGRGVCGTAVAEQKNQVIEDVRELDNYLACSLETRSELVVLIYAASAPVGTPIPTLPPPKEQGEGQKLILGQIDIDGHQVGAFDATDEKLLEDIAVILAARWHE